MQFAGQSRCTGCIHTIINAFLCQRNKHCSFCLLWRRAWCFITGIMAASLISALFKFQPLMSVTMRLMKKSPFSGSLQPQRNISFSQAAFFRQTPLSFSLPRRPLPLVSLRERHIILVTSGESSRTQSSYSERPWRKMAACAGARLVFSPSGVFNCGPCSLIFHHKVEMSTGLVFISLSCLCLFANAFAAATRGCDTPADMMEKLQCS